MDYEKKYKEALERAKQIQSTPYTAHWDIMKEVCEELFPELKESEDEKIRNFVFKIFKDAQRYGVCETIMPEQFNKIFAWLDSLRPQSHWKPSEEMLEALYRVIPENVMEKSEDEMLLDKLYQGLKYGRVLSNK